MGTQTDLQLIAKIQAATQGAARVLCALARLGKAIERDDAPRAELFIASVRSHPFYKGGRLAFDMLEVEDLMLAWHDSASIDRRRLADVGGLGPAQIVEFLRELGARPDENTYADQSLATDLPNGVTELPRVVFGDADESPATDDGGIRDVFSEDATSGVELTSSDYLYDYVIIGLFDVVLSK